MSAETGNCLLEFLELIQGFIYEKVTFTLQETGIIYEKKTYGVYRTGWN